MESEAAEFSYFASALLVGVALSAAAVWPLSELLLWLYRRSVIRSMGGAQAPPKRAAAPDSVAPIRTGPLTLSMVSASEPSPASSSQAAATLFERATRARTQTAFVYAAAGLVCAAVLTTATVARLRLAPLTWPLLLVAFAWPVTWMAFISGVLTRRMIAVLAAVHVVVFLAAVFTIANLFIGLMMGNAFLTAVATVLRVHRIRAVAPLVAGFISIQVATFLTMPPVVGVFTPLEGSASNPSAKNPFAMLAAVLLLFVTGPVMGWLALRVLGRSYEGKHASDQAITVGSMWFLFVLSQSLAFAYNDTRWMLAGACAFASFVVVSLFGFTWMRQRGSSEGRGPRLLVLRVFALGRRSRRLFDAISDTWRHVGSVQLIAGPDLATATVEPHEFYDFLRRKLESRFIDDEQAVGRRLSEMDLDPDHDGRFRVTDFFCRDHAWRMVLGRLARETDVVLMDLRGFSKANAGCVYEIGELLNTVAVPRIVLVCGKDTDEAFLSQILEDAWQRMAAESPNHGAPSASLRVFRETGSRGLDGSQLLRVLCHAAAEPATRHAAQPA